MRLFVDPDGHGEVGEPRAQDRDHLPQPDSSKSFLVVRSAPPLPAPCAAVAITVSFGERQTGLRDDATLRRGTVHNKVIDGEITLPPLPPPGARQFQPTR